MIIKQIRRKNKKVGRNARNRKIHEKGFGASQKGL